MAEREKQAKLYPTYLTDAEWDIVRPFLPTPPKRGCKPTTDLREVLNALRYLARSGGGWRMLPKDFPPWQTVYWWFRRFVRRLLFRTIHDVALMLDRESEAREQSPSAAVVDSQSIKAPSAPSGGGYDAGKRIKGRKRHTAIRGRESRGSFLTVGRSYCWRGARRGMKPAIVTDPFGRARRQSPLATPNQECDSSPRCRCEQ